MHEYNLRYWMGGIHTYTYSSVITFKIKQNKFKIEIKNISCVKATRTAMGATHNVTPIEVFENGNYTTIKSIFDELIPPAKQDELMQMIKTDMQSLVDTYVQYIKTQKPINDDW